MRGTFRAAAHPDFRREGFVVVLATVSEHGREAGKQYRVKFFIGSRLIWRRKAKWVKNDDGEPAWEPDAHLKASPAELEASKQDRMLRQPAVRR